MGKSPFQNKRNYPIFSVLSDNARSMIFCFLNKNGESTFTQIYDHLIGKNYDRNTDTFTCIIISHVSLVIKLADLKKIELIKSRKDPDNLRAKLYSINQDGLKNLRLEYLEMIGDESL